MLLRQLFRDSVIYGGADFVFKLIAFWTFPLIAAALAPNAFGALELLLTATSLLGMIANCGLNNALQRFYWDAQTELNLRPVLVSSGFAALMTHSLVAAVLAGLGVSLYIGWVDEVPALLGASGLFAGLILMVAGQLVQYLLDVTRLHMAPLHFICVSMASRVMTAVAGLVTVVWLSGGLNGLLAAQALVMILTVPLGLYAVRSDITWRIDTSVTRKLLKFGYPFVYTGLAFWLLGSIDRWLLASMTSVEDVGVFSVAHRFASIVLFVSMAFGQAWSPIAIKIQTDHPENYRTFYANILLMLMSVMTFLGGGVALFAPELVAWLMPVEYHGAGSVLSVLALGLILQSTMQVTAVGISIETKTYLFSRLTWVAAALNLGLNFVLIPLLGALGAAVVTSLCYLFLTVMYLYYTQKLHPLPLPWCKGFLVISLWLVLVVCVFCMSLGYSGATSLFTRGTVMLMLLVSCLILITQQNINQLKLTK